jgi:predicted HicB family RNase H-like nuclease
MKKPPIKPTALQAPTTQDEFISQGAQPPVAPMSEEKPIKAFSLRMEPELLKELQEIKDAQPRHLRSSIHQFIIQAITEKVAKVKQTQKKLKPDPL